MFLTNNDPVIMQQAPKELGIYAWPTAQNQILFWSPRDKSLKEREQIDPNGTYIIAQGNSVLWVLCFIAYLFNIAWIMLGSLKQGKLIIGHVELVLIVGYLANYLPFFLIHRPMYLYHYFTALLFLFLLVPYILPRIRHCLELTTQDRWFSYVFVAVALGLVVVNYVLNSNFIYGYSI